MAKLNSELRQALRERDEARRLLGSLERLQSDESISDDDRLALRHDYEERLRSADVTVQEIRDSIDEQLRGVANEREKLGQEQATLEVRHKVGELDSDQYRKASDSVRACTAELDRQKSSLGALLKAESEADLSGTAAPVARQATGAAPAVAPAAVHPQSFAARVAGLSGRRLQLVSGGLIAVGVVAIVILFMQAGGAGLPSLPNPFAGGGLRSTGPEAGQEPAASEEPGETVPVQIEAGSLTTAGTDFDVPLQLRGISRVASLHVEMAFDAAQIELLSVTAGTLPPDALFQYGVSNGRVAFGIVSVDGMDGDFTVANIAFRVLPGADRTSDAILDLGSIQAHDALTLSPVAMTPVPGRVNLATLAVSPAAVESY